MESEVLCCEEFVFESLLAGYSLLRVDLEAFEQQVIQLFRSAYDLFVLDDLSEFVVFVEMRRERK